MRVKELAELTGTTVRTIRYYHQIGLLPVPSQVGGVRDYGMAQLARLLRIRWLVDSGVALSAIPAMIAEPAPGGPDELDVICNDLALTLAGIDARVKQLRGQRAQVLRLLRTTADGGPVSPMPKAVHEMYDRLLAMAGDPVTTRVIEAERQVVEFACYQGELPPFIAELAGQITDEQLGRIMAMFEDFGDFHAQQATLSGDEAARRVDRMADQAAEFVEGLALPPELVTALLGQTSIPSEGYVGYAMTTMLPDGFQVRFKSAFENGLTERGLLVAPDQGEGA